MTNFLLAHNTVHEMTHLWWVASTNENTPEVYGFQECIDLAWDCDDEPAHGDPQAVLNADSYAFYAEFGYWVEQFS